MDNQRLTVTDAKKMLGVSKKKIAALLADGVLPFETDILDKRVKLVKLIDIEKLQEQRLRKAA